VWRMVGVGRGDCMHRGEAGHYLRLRAGGASLHRPPTRLAAAACPAPSTQLRRVCCAQPARPHQRVQAHRPGGPCLCPPHRLPTVSDTPVQSSPWG
jgi:hypothetical protein